MKFLVTIIVLLAVNHAIRTARVGIIRNASLMVMPSSNITINRSTCNECLCAMLMNTGNCSIVSFNCYIRDVVYVVCQLFTITNYQMSSSYQIQTNANSTFYFLRLPFSNQSEITTVNTVTASEATTTTDVITTTSSHTTSITSSATTSTSTTSSTRTTTITFTPVGIYALAIPTCATWNENATTVAGNQNGTLGSALESLYNPASILVDNNDTLYIADRDNNRIVKYYVNATVGILVAGSSTVGNDSNELNGPKDVAIDQYGAIIVADSNNYPSQKFLPNSTVGITLTSNSSFNPLGQMRDLYIDINNNIYVTDSDNNQVVKFTPSSSFGVITAGGGAPGPALNQLNSPFGNFMDGNDILYVADLANHRVLMYLSESLNGTVVAGITSTPGSNLIQLNGPLSVIVDNNGELVFRHYGQLPRSGPKALIGEFAVVLNIDMKLQNSPPSDFIPYPTMKSAVAESIYRIGFERNSDIVIGGCYAPVLPNIADTQWTPAFIVFNASTVVKSTSYLAQQMFGQHLGNIVLNSTASKKNNIKQSIVHKGGEGDGKLGNLYFIATKDTKNNTLVIKLANVDANDILVNTQILKSSTSYSGIAYTLSAGAGVDPSSVQNTLLNPNAASIHTTSLAVINGTCSITVPSWSVVVVTIPL